MKTFLKCMAIASLALCSFSCKGKQESVPSGKEPRVLVCYFSATGNTRADAERLARITGGDLFVIEPQIPYSDADLDWNDPSSRSSRENDDPAARPELKALPDNMDEYDVVFVGFPNWWDCPPRIINTFLDGVSLKGKTVVPFMTSASSSISHSEKVLKEAYPALKWEKGLRTTGASEKQLSEWSHHIIYND